MMLRLPQAAAALGVSLSTVRRLIDSERLRVVQLSPGRVGIESSELERYVRAQTSGGIEACAQTGGDRLDQALASAMRLLDGPKKSSHGSPTRAATSR
jgi:excisionase family DNA binding protein